MAEISLRRSSMSSWRPRTSRSVTRPSAPCSSSSKCGTLDSGDIRALVRQPGALRKATQRRINPVSIKRGEVQVSGPSRSLRLPPPFRAAPLATSPVHSPLCGFST